jgi:hypothetical protein
MTDEAEVRKRAVAAILRGVAKKTLIMASVAAAIVFLVSLLQGGGRWWFLPASVLFGAGLGVLNFRWLALAVQRVYLRQGATAGVSNLAAAIISILKLSTIFIILFFVIKWQVLHVFGLVGGLSVCFLAIIWEGATAVKTAARDRHP